MAKTPIDYLLMLIAIHRVMLAPLLALRSKRWKYHLRVLRQKRLARAHLGVFETRLAVYQLTPKGCRRAKVSLNRSRPLGPEAMGKHLALTFFLMTHPEYKRLSRKELTDLLEAEPPPGVHLDHGITWQVYIPGEDTSVRMCVRRLKERIEQAESVESWIALGNYGFLILADNESKAAQIRKAITDIEARVSVLVAPGPRTIPLALKGLSNGKA